MKVMGLDVAKQTTGWAVFDGSTWSSGVVRCPVKRPKNAAPFDAWYVGAVLDWYAQAMQGLIAVHEPDFVAIEAPLVVHGTTNAATLHMAHAVTSEVARVLTRLGIPAEYVSQHTWRSAFGVRRPTKTDKAAAERWDGSRWNKDEAVRCCRLLGLEPRSADEAEAVGIATWAWGWKNPASPSLFGEVA